MSNLIQVPKDAEQIKEFLADGQARGVPYVQNADINDGDILGSTKTVDLGGGSYKFVISLPSGRSLESAPVSADYPKRDATFQWIEAVRANIVGDADNAAETAYQLAREREPVANPFDEDVRGLGSVPGLYPSQADAGAGVQRSVSTADPVEYAKQQLSAALARLAAVASAEADVERWTKVVAAFGGDVPTGTKRRKKRKHKKAPVKGL